MSDVDVVRRCIDAISNRDVATLVALSTDDVEIRPLRAALEDTQDPRERGRHQRHAARARAREQRADLDAGRSD
jgi:ketosteroid isomerase-like protein